MNNKIVKLIILFILVLVGNIYSQPSIAYPLNAVYVSPNYKNLPPFFPSMISAYEYVKGRIDARPYDVKNIWVINVTTHPNLIPDFVWGAMLCDRLNNDSTKIVYGGDTVFKYLGKLQVMIWAQKYAWDSTGVSNTIYFYWQNITKIDTMMTDVIRLPNLLNTNISDYLLIRNYNGFPTAKKNIPANSPTDTFSFRSWVRSYVENMPFFSPKTSYLTLTPYDSRSYITLSNYTGGINNIALGSIYRTNNTNSSIPVKLHPIFVNADDNNNKFPDTLATLRVVRSLIPNISLTNVARTNTSNKWWGHQDFTEGALSIPVPLPSLTLTNANSIYMKFRSNNDLVLMVGNKVYLDSARIKQMIANIDTLELVRANTNQEIPGYKAFTSNAGIGIKAPTNIIYDIRPTPTDEGGLSLEIRNGNSLSGVIPILFPPNSATRSINSSVIFNGAFGFKNKFFTLVNNKLYYDSKRLLTEDDLAGGGGGLTTQQVMNLLRDDYGITYDNSNNLTNFSRRLMMIGLMNHPTSFNSYLGSYIYKDSTLKTYNITRGTYWTTTDSSKFHNNTIMTFGDVKNYVNYQIGYVAGGITPSQNINWSGKHTFNDSVNIIGGLRINNMRVNNSSLFLGTSQFNNQVTFNNKINFGSILHSQINSELFSGLLRLGTMTADKTIEGAFLSYEDTIIYQNNIRRYYLLNRISPSIVHKYILWNAPNGSQPTQPGRMMITGNDTIYEYGVQQIDTLTYIRTFGNQTKIGDLSIGGKVTVNRLAIGSGNVYNISQKNDSIVVDVNSGVNKGVIKYNVTAQECKIKNITKPNTDGQLLTIINVGTETLIIANNVAVFPNNLDVELTPKSVITLIYDSFNNEWLEHSRSIK